ncbi:MAG: hypothetical protein R3B70_07195 [Polyangiaceae bacterium]
MANRTLTSIEIPQADSLENVRRVVDAIASGASSRKEISDKTDISVRHIDYAIHAAKSLGLLAQGDALSTSGTGSALAATERGSAEEREQFHAAIKANEVIQMLAPDLLDDAAPAKATLTERIQKACPDLSEATAARRAQTLLAWRSQALSEQISLPYDPEAEAAAAAAEEAAAAEAAAAAPPKAKPAAKKAAPKKTAKKAAPKKTAKKAAPKKTAAKKAAAPKKTAAKKAAAPKKTAAKKAAAPKKTAAKKAAPKKAAKPAAKKPGPRRKPEAAKKPETAAAPAPAAEPAAAPAREVTYEMDPS